MDLAGRLQQLEEMVRDAKSMPLSSSALLNRDEVLEMIPEMQESLPEEIKQARWIVKDREELLGKARHDAERTWIRPARTSCGWRARKSRAPRRGRGGPHRGRGRTTGRTPVPRPRLRRREARAVRDRAPPDPRGSADPDPRAREDARSGRGGAGPAPRADHRRGAGVRQPRPRRHSSSTRRRSDDDRAHRRPRPDRSPGALPSAHVGGHARGTRDRGRHAQDR